jgi:hypothetical protein
MTQFKTAGERVRMQISVAAAVSFLLHKHFRLCCRSSFVFVADAVSTPDMISRPAFKYAFAVAIVPGMDAARRSDPGNGARSGKGSVGRRIDLLGRRRLKQARSVPFSTVRPKREYIPTADLRQ